jgi:ribose-phosphate pyrophosphokinase
MKLFSGSHSRDFSNKISSHLNMPLGNMTLSTYKDGEISVIIEENVRNHNCIVIQSCCQLNGKSVNDSIMETLIIVDALKRGSASKVVVVLPYYGYSRSDRKDYSRAPISANVVARCLESMNVNRVIVYDLHAGQIAGFFSNNCPLDNLYNEVYFITYIRNSIINMDELVIVAPDEGAVKTATRISNKLGCRVATIYKQRSRANEIDHMRLMGDVSGKIAILVDDIIDTGGTACKAAEILIDNGAREVNMLASHGIFSGNALEKINNSQFNSVVVTNTITHRNDVIQCDKIKVIDVSWLCAEAIRRQDNGESLTELYANRDILEDNQIQLDLI